MANRPIEHYGSIVLTNTGKVCFLGKRSQKNFLQGHTYAHKNGVSL